MGRGDKYSYVSTSGCQIICAVPYQKNADYSDALRLEPNSPEVLTSRALVLFLTNHIPSAIQHVQSALRYDPEHTRARLLLRRARDIEKLKEGGNSAFKSGRHAEAVNKYTETLNAIGERPEEGEGGQLRALILGNRATALSKVRGNISLRLTFLKCAILTCAA